MYDDSLKGPMGLMTVLSMRGVGAVTAEKILARFSTLRELHEAAPEQCKGVLNATLAANFRDRTCLGDAYAKAEREVGATLDMGARIVTAFDAEYPERLAGVIERPLVLYVRGNLPASGKMFGCVGTREMTPFGQVVTERFVGHFADAGWSPVSRITRGIDATAHDTASLYEVPSVGILGGGLDVMQSDRQAELVEKIVEGGGAVVTEYALGREPEQGSDIRRNRLVSGMSCAVFILQAAADEDTLQAARYAIIHGRPLFAPVPSGRNAEDPACHGLTLLTSGTGVDLVNAIRATGSFVQTISERFADCPVAEPIRSRDDYAAILNRLEDGLGLAHAPSP